MKTGVSVQKENAVTAFATTASALKEDFDPHFAESVDLLLSCLNENPQPAYRQFRAQTIEAITLISSHISPTIFAQKAEAIVAALIYIQKSNMDDTDPQRSYLLSAWQRICLVMKTDFVPYLDEILPPIFNMASLKVSMGIEGRTEAEITDVLNEIRPDDQGEKKANIMTDEIEEKDSAVQMLTVFMEELGAGYAKFAEPSIEILLGLTQFDVSDNIRINSAGALPHLIRVGKAAAPDNVAALHDLAKKFCNNIIDAMETETETECLIAQAGAIKDIMEEAGNNLLQADSVDVFSKKMLEFMAQSEKRIKENEKYQNENVDEEDGLDEEDLAVLKEENKNENELQLALAECIGMLFKTHKESCRNLVQTLQASVLPEIAKQTTKPKQKLLLFFLDDMVEFLGPDFLGPAYG